MERQAIKKLNKGGNLPSTSITVVHRSDGSGTTYNFTDYLSHVSGSWKSQVGTGTAVAWPTGEGEPHSSGVAGAVKSTDGAIGYVDVDYAIVNHLRIFKMKNRAGKFVLPRRRASRPRPRSTRIRRRTARSRSSTRRRARSTGTRTRSAPTRTSIVQKTSGANAADLKKLIGWAITKGQSYGPPIVFEPLPKSVVTFDKKQIKKIHS